MNDIKKLTEMVIKFRDERDWKQFHNPKDLALSIVLEASEVLERFQWKNPEEISKYLKNNKSEVADELADVVKYLIIMCHDLNIDIEKAVVTKMKKDAKKYPVHKSKGNHKKYSEF